MNYLELQIIFNSVSACLCYDSNNIHTSHPQFSSHINECSWPLQKLKAYTAMYSELFTAVKLILLLLLCLTTALLDMYMGLCPALWSCRNLPIRAEPDTFSVSAQFSKWMSIINSIVSIVTCIEWRTQSLPCWGKQALLPGKWTWMLSDHLSSDWFPVQWGDSETSNYKCIHKMYQDNRCQEMECIITM